MNAAQRLYRDPDVSLWEFVGALKQVDDAASVAHDFIYGLNGVTKEQASSAIWLIHNTLRPLWDDDPEPSTTASPPPALSDEAKEFAASPCYATLRRVAEEMVAPAPRFHDAAPTKLDNIAEALDELDELVGAGGTEMQDELRRWSRELRETLNAA